MPKKETKKVVTTTVVADKAKPATQNKRRRNRRKRTNNKRKNNILSRTTNTVEQDLRSLRISAGNNTRGNWPACRLMPWNMGGSSSLLPDGTSSRRLVQDFYSWSDVVVSGTATFSLIIFPALPYQALLTPQSSGTYTITTSYGLTGTPSGLSSSAFGMYNLTFTSPGAPTPPIPINCTLSGDVNSYNDAATAAATRTYIAADKARMTSFGWRLIYTGAASTCTGLITVAQGPMTIDPLIEKTAGRLNIISPTNVTNTISCTTADRSSVLCLPISLPGNFAQNRDTVTIRPEVAPKGDVRHSGTVFEWKEIYQRQPVPVQIAPGNDIINGEVNTLFSGGYNGLAVGLPATVTHGSLQFIDPQFDVVNISLIGVTGSFRLETFSCVEFQPNTASPLYNFGDVMAEQDIDLIATTEAQVTKLPVAMPSNGSCTLRA